VILIAITVNCYINYPKEGLLLEGTTIGDGVCCCCWCTCGGWFYWF